MGIMTSRRATPRPVQGPCSGTRATPPALCWLLVAALSGCETSDAVVAPAPAGSGTTMNGAESASGTGSVPSSSGSAGMAAPSGASGSSAAASGSPAITPPNTAGSGGQGAMAGQGGTASIPPSTGQAGKDSATSGQTAMGGTGAAGSGAAANGDCRPDKFTLATRISIEATWPETLGIMGGSTLVHSWGKITFQRSGDAYTTEYRVCGVQPAVYTGTAVTGNIKLYQAVPQETFDKPGMPTVMGKASRVGSMFTIEPGPMVIGVMLTDPNGAWPNSPTDSGYMQVDVDADGKPGVTTLMKDGEGFMGSPVSILQTDRVDQIYGAQRLTYTTTLPDPDCAETLESTAEVSEQDTLILGCHVKDRGDCTPDERTFIDDNRSRPTRGKATWSAKLIADDATCVQAHDALAVPGPGAGP